MSKKVLVLYHGKLEKAETFKTIFDERGWQTENIFTPTHDIPEIDPLKPDLVLVMGGPMGVYEQDKYPYLAHEISFLEERLAADRPTLGICLGSQLMAAALGKEVSRGNAGKEIGWAPLTMTKAGQEHPVRHFDGSLTQMFHWHGDTFQVPDNARLLASSEAYINQAYEIGNALALQFHPEVTQAQLEKWFIGDMRELEQSILCTDIEKIREQTANNVSILNTQTRKMMDEWLPRVGLE